MVGDIISPRTSDLVITHRTVYFCFIKSEPIPILPAKAGENERPDPILPSPGFRGGIKEIIDLTPAPLLKAGEGLQKRLTSPQPLS